MKSSQQKTLYVTDLDGTLMRGDKTLSEFTVNTLNQLIDQGMLITYATARTFESAWEITKDIHFKIPVITRNGAVFADQILKKETDISHFSEEAVSTLKKLLTGTIERVGFVTAYFDGEMAKTYRDGKLCPGLQKYVDAHANDRRMRVIGEDSDLFDGVVTYITLIADRDELQPVYEKVRNAGDWECNFQQDNYGDEYWLEIGPPNATKAKAVLKCKEELLCDRVVVFGDSVNDLSMFAVADEACVVENGIEEVKSAATVLIPSNENDGVAIYLLRQSMYNKIETWLNDVLEHKVPSEISSEIRAFCFNLYEDGDGDWSVELVGTESFDPDDEDWACDEITDFGTREEPFFWKKESGWNEVLSEVSSALKQYLENGLHADVLKSCMGVAVGFTDGNLEILYSAQSGMTQAGITDNTVMKDKIQGGLPDRDDDTQAQKRNRSAVSRRKSFEPVKKSADMRAVVIFIVALNFIACLCFWYFINRSIVADNQNPGGAQQENNVDRTSEEKEEAYVPETAMPDAASDSYTLICDGVDTGLEIFLKDCACEYNRDSIQLYSCFVDNAAVEAKGYAIYIRTPEEEMQIFPVKDYRVDENAGRLYMLWGTEVFERIQGIDFVNGINGFKLESTNSMEDLIGDAYGLELSDSDENFDDLQLEFTGLYQKDGKTLLGGKASALYHITGKRYSVGWEIDTESLRVSTKAYLADFDIHPLYAAFLRNEISVKNPFVPEDDDRYNTKLSFFDDKDYEDEHMVFWKYFSLVDVNGDGNAELVFGMSDSPSKVVYILGVQDDELICYDIHETHTSRMSYSVHDNGIVWWGQSYDGAESIYYTFNDKGKVHELIHFVREENSDSDLYYDYYYLEGNEESRVSLQSDEEYESLVSSYEGEGPKWFACEAFADIPRNPLITVITETELVEKNAKNTNELRISTSITKLWLNEDEEGAAEINAALREIYEAAEAEMEAYNQEILEEYLFEDGALQEDLDEWLLYPLDEWLAISDENYVASIEYVDANYLCLRMDGDNYVAGGAHGEYWSDYYVFDRHTGQRLFLEDFVNDSAEDIKKIVKARILAVAPYSGGEQSEDALEQDRFFLTAEGLGIHYDVYEISDYASGAFDFIIPFEMFDMKED